MARATLSFATVLADLARRVPGPKLADRSEDEVEELVMIWNAAYREAWIFNPWEDTWDEGEIAVTAGLVDYADIGHGRVWNFFSADPRDDATACYFEPLTAKAGIRIPDGHDTVYGFWRPVCPQWEDADDETAVIEVLRDPALAFAEAAYYRQITQWQTAAARRADAQAMCDTLAETEFPRLQTKHWLRRRD